MKSNIHNRILKNGIIFTDLCTKKFCNKHDFMNHSIEVYFTVLVFFRRYEDLIRMINYELSQATSPKASSRSARECVQHPYMLHSYGIVYNV